MFRKPSVIVLLIANLVPVFGVVFFEWTFASVLYLYFFEIIIVGFYGVLHLWMAPLKRFDTGEIEPRYSRRLVLKRIVFTCTFAVVFGAGLLCIGGFLSIVFPLFESDLKQLMPAIAALFVSHGVSYYLNFLGKAEYQYMSAREIFVKPFQRMMLPYMILAIISYPLLHLILNDVGPVLLFVFFKIVVDLNLHIWEHRTFWMVALKDLNRPVQL